MNVDNTEDIRIISLCSGYGGLELGLRRVFGERIRTVVYVEVEAFAVANLVAKMEAGLLDVAPVWTDIKTFDGSGFRGKVHGITAGYPCQPFSIAGRRKGKADPRHLWPHIAGVVQAVRPVWCFFENVPGHLTLGFPEVYRELRNMAYSVEAGLFTAAECGAPHRRERLFILAYNAAGRRPSSDLPIRQSQRQNQAEIDFMRTCQLADAESKRFKTCQPGGNQEARPRLADQGGNDCWPARPGQPQYEWEEPRVVGDAKCSGRFQGSGKREEYRGIKQTARVTSSSEKRGSGYETRQQKAQSRLGGKFNGTSSRVDRLRLLGNGVVPQQAELAFRSLARRMALFEPKDSECG